MKAGALCLSGAVSVLSRSLGEGAGTAALLLVWLAKSSSCATSAATCAVSNVSVENENQ